MQKQSGDIVISKAKKNSNNLLKNDMGLLQLF